ncbi:probable leucine-rich repeat receptor-like protein kinase At1g68400 [Cornus florida]|uniref:probable leucine-rich repeat receptor-like protein kinase At1g68400 n=1 Tax=Cornus florida TaxID=4283 RepID=UPI0028A17D69|nr:probable leucine-rich repeat receptor-like protein kinase At1g68400 [Cornus florida]
MNLALKLCVTYYVVFMAQLSITAVLVLSNEIEDYYPDERDALMQLRDFVNSTSDLHGNWTGPPCINNLSRYVGIACSNWHVTSLVLEGIQITGSLPPQAFLQNLTHLSKLSFRNNSIYGPLPNLTNLLNIEFLFLSHNRFSGSIPSEYTRLPKLSQLELQENDLGGGIPAFDQQTLTVFNVSYNRLEGPIPDTDVLQRFPKSSYDNNSDLCGRPLGIQCPAPPPNPAPAPSPLPTPSNHKNKGPLQLWSIVLIVAAAVLVPLFVMLAVFLCRRRKQHGKEAKRDQPAGEVLAEGGRKKRHWSESTEDPERTVELEFLDKDRPVFDLDDLLRASAEVMGKGKIGTTYKALLELGPAVAVKRVKDMNGLSKKEFIQQMQLIGKMSKHENLVEIISFYYSKEEKLVIFEFVPDGDLFELLHENRGVGRVPLNWVTRLSIIKDIAKGLNFLHQSLPSHKVPHANLKSSNVLIMKRDNQNYQSKLTDFGFLPLLPSRRSSQKLAVGKVPEFSQGKKLTHKADVYCFGIIVLEVITGKIPGQISGGIENKLVIDDLSDWVRTVVNNDWSTDILDMEILGAKEGHDEMLKLTEIALECTDMAPERRPKMSEVLRRIEDIILHQTSEGTESLN